MFRGSWHPGVVDLVNITGFVGSLSYHIHLVYVGLGWRALINQHSYCSFHVYSASEIDK